MLEKIITPHEFTIPTVNVIHPSDYFGIKCANECGTSACGRLSTGCAETCATKEANSELKEFVHSLDPDKKKLYLHIIALGSGEFFGANSNGDYFPEQGLIRKHKTFVVHAKVYKHHINKDPNISYGEVPFATYNKPMHRVELIIAVDKTKAPDIVQRAENGERLGFSMSCFPPGTLVLLSGRGECPIEEVPVGSRVFTHTGKIGEVEALMEREYKGDMISFYIWGLPDEIKCTPSHKMWTRKTLQRTSRCPVCGGVYDVLQHHLLNKTDSEHKYALEKFGKMVDGMLPAEELISGDYVRTPFPTETISKGDETYASILGYFISHGSKPQIPIDKSHKYPKQFIRFTFTKRMSVWKDHLLSLLGQYGCRKSDIRIRKTGDSVSWQIDVSNNLLYVQLGVSAERYSCKGYEKGQYAMYSLSGDVMGWDPKTQLNILKSQLIHSSVLYDPAAHQVVTDYKSRHLAFQMATIAWRNNILVSVTRFDNNVRGGIYRLTFQCGQIDLLENKDFKFNTNYGERSLGYIEDGFVYRPVTNITRYKYDGKVYNLSVTGDSSYIANRIAVSNCKIPGDRCSICGNFARKKSEYCSHIKDELLKIYKDGRQSYMINEDPTFFDISYVLRPADKTAMLISKVASKSIEAHAPKHHNEIGVLEIKEMLKPGRVTVTDDKSALNASDLIDLGFKSGAIRKVFHSILEPVESKTDCDNFKTYILPAIDSGEPQLPIEKLSAFSLNDIVSTLTASGVLCGPAEYKKIMIITHSGEDIKPDISCDHFNDDIFDIIKNILPERSIYNPHISTRVVKLFGDTNEKSAGQYVIQTPTSGTALDQKSNLARNMLLLGALAGGGYAAYKTEVGRKAIDTMITMMKNKPVRFALLAGLGFMAIKTLTGVERRPVMSDSLLQYQQQIPSGANGIIISKQSSSDSVHPELARLASHALNPFGMLCLESFLDNSNDKAASAFNSINGYSGQFARVRPKLIKSPLVQKAFKSISPGM